MTLTTVKELWEPEASARAAQIYAEMLGMVCHKEYIQHEQSQTVFPRFFLILFKIKLNIRILGFCSSFRWFHGLRLLGHFPIKLP